MDLPTPSQPNLFDVKYQYASETLFTDQTDKISELPRAGEYITFEKYIYRINRLIYRRLDDGWESVVVELTLHA